MFKSKWRKADRAARARQHELVALERQPESLARPPPPPPAPKQDYLDSACHRTYSCIHCRAHLANHDELISKLFQGNHGRAYLFNKVVNIGCKQAVERELLTGLHAVADIYCDSCETTLGWKYEQAFVPSQKYKEGKYIIELVHMLKENNWDLTSHNTKELMCENNIGFNSPSQSKARWLGPALLSKSAYVLSANNGNISNKETGSHVIDLNAVTDNNDNKSNIRLEVREAVAAAAAASVAVEATEATTMATGPTALVADGDKQRFYASSASAMSIGGTIGDQTPSVSSMDSPQTLASSSSQLVADESLQLATVDDGMARGSLHIDIVSPTATKHNETKNL